MAVLGFPFEEAYREMDRLLDAAGGTGMLRRNINAARGLCNGTRLIVHDAP